MGKKKKDKTKTLRDVLDEMASGTAHLCFEEEKGGDNDEFETLIDEIESSWEESPEEKKEADELPQPSKPMRKLSAHELFERFLEKYHVYNIAGSFYVYDGLLYRRADKNQMIGFLRSALNRDELIRLNMRDLNGFYEYISTEASIQIPEIPIYPGCVTFQNGLFNIVLNRKLEPSPEQIFLYQVDAKYKPGKFHKTPVFDKFLNQCSGFDPEIKRLILAFLGYCLIPDQDGKCCFVLGVAPNSGKSILGQFLHRLVGHEVVSGATLDDLSNNNFMMAQVVGKVLNLSMDLSSDCLNGKAVSNLKMLIGQDIVSINAKYVNPFPYRNIAKFVFATNSPIRLKKFDQGFWDRLVIIPFQYSVAKEDQDKDLLDKLWKERSGIVCKAMAAARKLIDDNYIFPECAVARRMKEDWMNITPDSIEAFIEWHCDFSDPNAKTHMKAIEEKYLEFCEENGFKPESNNALSRALGRRGLKRSRWCTDGSGKLYRGFEGTRLK